MQFKEIAGHEGLKGRLVKGADEGRVSHAQLFVGESGSGALPLALAYAQYLNCESPSGGDSCGECPSCRKYAELVHPDLHFVFPSNSSKNPKPLGDTFLAEWRKLWSDTRGNFDEQQWYERIKIENKQGIISRAEAENVMRKLSLKAFEARWKTVVIWLPERMRPEAANAMLKILEEPWEKTLFLLVSGEPQELLPTVLSRVQRIDVAGDALEDPVVRKEFFDLFTRLMRLSYNDRHIELLEWADSVSNLGRETQKRLLAYSVAMLRENYMLAAGMSSIVSLSGDELAFSKNFSPFIGNDNIEPLVHELELATAHIAGNGNPRMVFTHTALAISKMISRK